MYYGTKAACREAKEPAATADIQESLAIKTRAFQSVLQRPFRLRYFFISECREKFGPILSELESFSSPYFDLMLLINRLRHGIQLDQRVLCGNDGEQ